MQAEVQEFAREYGLSPREMQILELLAQKVVHFKDIAARLEVSPSTINNHLKSIFAKTQSQSKSQLLATFLHFVLHKYQSCKSLHRKPEVLVIDDEPEICELIAEELTSRGMKVHTSSDPTSVIDFLKNSRIDVVISDIRMPGMDGIQLLKDIRKIFRYFPLVLFVSGYSKNQELDTLLSIGACALLDKPIDMDRLFRVIMDHYLDENHARHRYTRVASDISLKLGENLTLTAENLGYGGVFIPFTPGERLNTMQIGQTIAFQFKLDSDRGREEFNVLGEIVWKRNEAKGGLNAGVGVKFMNVSDLDREKILDHVRLNNILSYIPLGSAEPAA
jgi:DNA-binding NarL/FixJ family response regulator